MATDLSTVDGSTPLWAAPVVHSFSVDDFHRLSASGVLRAEDRVELVDGCIFDMTPIGAPHATSVQKTLAALWNLALRSAPGAWHVRVQQPLTLKHSEPQPDLAIVRGTPDDYASRHPVASDVGLVIEVADASLDFDRGRKLAAYAAEGVEAYWIVDLVHRRVDAYQRPTAVATGANYAEQVTVDANGELPIALADVEAGRVQVRDLLP